MGFTDKLFGKKKKEEDLGDLGDFSDLGDFGLPESSGATPGDQTAGLSGTGELGGLPSGGDNHPSPVHENVTPSPASQQMGTDLGLTSPDDGLASAGAHPQVPTPQPTTSPAASAPSQPQQRSAPQATAQQPQYPQPAGQPQQQFQTNMFSGGQGQEDLGKDMQIIQAKLDAIRSSVDSINRRLDNLERMAQGGRQQNSW